MDEHDVSVILQTDAQGDNRIGLIGVVDLFSVEMLRELASRCIASGRSTVVDCGKLERFDASVLQLLVVMERELRARGATLTLISVPENVSRYLRLSGSRFLGQEARTEVEPASCPTELNPGATTVDHVSALTTCASTGGVA